MKPVKQIEKIEKIDPKKVKRFHHIFIPIYSGKIQNKLHSPKKNIKTFFRQK
jgi:hypothetical protein